MLHEMGFADMKCYLFLPSLPHGSEKKNICEQLRTGETFKVLIAISNGSRTWVVSMRNG